MNKIIAPIALVVVLAGCNSFPASYDNNEYELLARLETTVRLISNDCGEPEKVKAKLPTLVADAELLHTYTFYIPQNTEVYQMADILKDDVREFEAQYDKGEATTLYCKLKAKTFLEKVRRSLEAVAKKKRV